MSSNKYQPHVLVLPEDDANRALANGFLLHPAVVAGRVQVLPATGGWPDVREAVARDRNNLARYPNRHLLLLVDFDDQPDRRPTQLLGNLPAEFKERVYLFGVLSNPEKLKAALDHRGLEEIGEQIAKDCHTGTGTILQHDLLLHNADEAARMARTLKPFLLPSAG